MPFFTSQVALNPRKIRTVFATIIQNHNADPYRLLLPRMVPL